MLQCPPPPGELHCPDLICIIYAGFFSLSIFEIMGELHHFFTDYVPMGPVHDGLVGMSHNKCEVSVFLNFLQAFFVFLSLSL